MQHPGIAFFLAPWRLVSLYLGTGALCVGADLARMRDWDAGLSYLMAVLCYLTSPWVVRVLAGGHVRWMPLAVFFTWLTVDGSYVGYSEWLHHEYYRRENFPASLALFFLTGVFWEYGDRVWRTSRDLRRTEGPGGRDRRSS